jgi:hypothetical protein
MWVSDAFVNGNVTASIDPSWILNQFDRNTISGNYGDNVRLDSKMEVEIDVNSSTIYNSVTAEVVEGTIDNLFADNTISNSWNGDGVDINNADIKVELVVDNRSIVGLSDDGDVTATIDNSKVTSQFDRNTISGNYYTNVEIEYASMDIELDVEDSSEVYGDVTGEIINSGFDNIFADNTINNSDDDSGVKIDTDLEVDMWVSNAFVNGNVTASIDPSWILNQFDRNTISGNYGDNVRLDSKMEVELDVNSSTIYNSVTTEILDGTIDNLFADNTINNSQYGDGVDINNTDITVELDVDNSSTVGGSGDGDVTATIDNSALTTSFTNNDISGNYSDGVEMSATRMRTLVAIDSTTVNGDVEASVTNSTVDNLFTDNTIDNNGDGGVSIGQDSSQEGIRARIDIDDDGSGSIITGSVTATVDPVSITNRFVDNSISNNQGEATGVDLNSYISARIGALSSTIVNGPVAALVDYATIDNILTGNTIDDNDGDGVDFDNTIRSRVNVRNSSTINNSVSATTMNVAVNNDLQQNSIDSNSDWGVDSDTTVKAIVRVANDSMVDGTATASLTNATVLHNFDQNSISDNDSGGVVIGGTETQVGAPIGADLIVRNSSTITNAATAEVVNVTVDNIFTDNTIDGNSGIATGVEIDNNVAANLEASDSLLLNGVASIANNVDISNEFTDNTITDNSGDGIDANSIILAFTDVDSSLIVGDVTGTVDQTAIVNIYNGNTITGNQGNAVDELNVNSARVHVFDSGPFRTGRGITGSTISNSVDASISSTFVDNTMTDNNDGIDTTNLLRATTWFSDSTSGGNVVSNLDSGDITLAYTNNTILTNTPGSLGVEESNILGATTCVDKTGFPVPCLAPMLGSPTPGMRFIGGAVISNTTDSSITSTFTSNIVNGVDTTNLLG